MRKMPCSGCHGRKKIWGAGMMVQHDCKYCKGTGIEEQADIADLVKEEKVIEAAPAPVASAIEKLEAKVRKRKK